MPEPRGWLDHNILTITKGIAATPTDTFSAESPLVVVNLLSGAIHLTPDGWNPQIAAVKSGGIWADSALSDGRELLAAPVANVTEKMTILIAAGGYLETMNAYSGLNQMALDCRNFGQTQVQIDPVYLSWWAGCGKGLQYALLYNIELAPTYLDGVNPTIRVDMTLEREPYWRMEVPPGANPKLWTLYTTGKQLGINATLLDIDLIVGNTLVSGLVDNKFEWTPAAAGSQTTPITANYIDIPSTVIKGDAPALSLVSVDQFSTNNMYIGISSKKQSLTNQGGTVKYNSLNLNVGDSDVSGTMAKTISGGNDGMLSNNSAVNLYYGLRTRTGVDANFVQVAQWGNSPPSANTVTLDRNFFRGTYAIFARASNNSAAPTLADMDMQVTVEEVENGSAAGQIIDSWTSPSVAVPIVVGGYAPISYIGTVTIPFANRVVNSLAGYGFQVQDNGSNSLRVTLYNRVNVATATRIMRAYDLIFMPVDEGLVQYIAPYNGSGLGSTKAVLDNTGYLLHGQLGQSCLGYSLNRNTGGVTFEVRGSDLELTPSKNYRMYFLSDQWITSTTITSVTNSIAMAFFARLDIVPRCSGIRVD